MAKILLVPVLCAVAACSADAPEAKADSQPAKVQTSGKVDVPLDQVPAAVLAAAKAEQPGFTPAQAQAETREGRRYFDIEGKLADGSELEFDIMEEGGRWRVVETQRDIDFSATPALVRQASAAHDPALVPTRVIESRQPDGLVLYELYAPAGGDPQGRKVEIKWDGSRAEILAREWAH
ncbi:MAG TPA: hypothetical protein VGD19_02175 [Allosphingosinicella sp.]|jgi:hypothetical protein